MSPPAITIESSLADAAKRLAEASESPRLDAETLFAWVLDGLKNVLRCWVRIPILGINLKDFQDLSYAVLWLR
jgi:hypothetical protein